ncbi:MAG: hypothetical protein Athens101426_681 [Parcubacteria group bacterium Athens1014_26]|nr:MAG: hypothetical protein Athens101426_681 [Parcubacteria group bacterium Athens1014_26]
MSKVEIYFTVIVLMSLFALLAHQYIFSIYEVEYKISSRVLYLNSDSKIVLEAIPVNSFGFRAPFRNSYTKFSIIQGKDLIEVEENNYEKGILIIKAKAEPGTVVIRVKSKFSLLPTEFEIKIVPNLA